MAAHCKGPEKRPDEMGQEVPQQEEGQVEVHERLGELEVPVEPCGLEWDWWLETWRLNTSGADQNISTFFDSRHLTVYPSMTNHRGYKLKKDVEDDVKRSFLTFRQTLHAAPATRSHPQEAAWMCLQWMC